ncbi:MAG: hypothetical protein AB8U25_01820 [Rickettsiales endosymbiont of Dermacentor nuttalli]
MLIETVSYKGTENYSKHLSGQKSVDILLQHCFLNLPKDALLFIDESYATVPQLMAMYR